MWQERSRLTRSQLRMSCEGQSMITALILEVGISTE